MKRKSFLAVFAALALMLTYLGGIASAGPVSDAAGFEGDDGDLAVQSTFDWNGFAPVEWEGTAPYRTSFKTVSAWDFTGIEDAQNDGNDTVFAGGTKQDENCATVRHGPKPPNKDDLKRIYLTTATKSVNGADHIFLALAWVRIPQNTTNASAHVGFEFNQNEGGCLNTTIPGNDGLSSRSTANGGDMLIVYDFAGSSTDTPTLKLLRWKNATTADTGDLCDATGKAVPAAGCWVFELDLTGGGFAEAKVNTSDVGSVTDQLAPPAPPATASVSESLGQNEFGEAIIDLTASGVFPEDGTECISFGRAFGVSRSSGNSQQAAMKDLVGPGDIELRNCGSIIIRKVTDPSPDPTDTEFDYTTTGGLDPETFSLKDGEDQDYGDEVLAGSYTVVEDDPGPLFALTDIDCSASDLNNGSTVDVNAAGDGVDIDLAPEDTIDCTFTNTLQTGAIEVTKTRKFASATSGDPMEQPHPGVTFEVYNDEDELVTSDVTGADGVVCFDGLAFGDYTVVEEVPAGYVSDAPNDERSVTVDNAATCDDDPFGGETLEFHNTPLTDVDIEVAAQDPGATKSSIDCVNSDDESVGSSGPVSDPASLSIEDLEPDTYTCTIFIDP